MFGNMLNKKMMGKVGEMQKQMEEIKAKLDNITVIGESDGGLCRVAATGNRMIKSIDLNENFVSNASKSEIENAIIEASNRALEQATRVEQGEMSHAAMGMLPGMG